MRFPISDQYQHWPYPALFSHNTTVTHRQTDGQQMRRACQRLQRSCSASKRRSLLLGDKVPFHRPYMPRWCIKVRGDDYTMATNVWFSVFLDFSPLVSGSSSPFQTQAPPFRLFVKSVDCLVKNRGALLKVLNAH